MPRIQQYETQVSADANMGGRRASTSDYVTSSPDSGKSLMNAGELLNQHVEQTEVSDASTKLAKARSDWTTNLQERTVSSEPGDPNFASKYTQDLGDYMQSMGNNYTTRAGQLAFQRQSAEVMGSLSQAAGAYQIHSAGEKAKQDYLQGLDSFRNTLIQDPDQFQSVLVQAQHALEDPAGLYAKMPRDQKYALVRQTGKELALSAAQGDIRRDPALALKQINEGKYAQYLDADKTYYLQNQAQFGINALEAKATHAAVMAHKAQLDMYEKTNSSNLLAFTSDAGLDMNTVRDQVASGKLNTEGGLLWLRMTNAANKPDTLAAVSHATEMDFFKRFALPEGDPNKVTTTAPIYEAFANGELNQAGMKLLESHVQNLKSEDGRRLSADVDGLLKVMLPQVMKANAIGTLDDSVAEQGYRYNYMVRKMVNDAVAAGKDPRELYLNPASKDYLGSAARIAPFQKNLAESAAYMQEKMARAPSYEAPIGGVPSALQRKGGETAEQFLARKAATTAAPAPAAAAVAAPVAVASPAAAAPAPAPAPATIPDPLAEPAPDVPARVGAENPMVDPRSPSTKALLGVGSDIADVIGGAAGKRTKGGKTQLELMRERKGK